MNRFSITDEAKKQVIEKIKKCKTIAGRFKKTIGMGVLAVSMALGSSLISHKEPINIGIVEDKSDDFYEKGVPIYESPETKVLFAMLSDGTLVTINDRVEKDNENYLKVSFLNKENKKLTGYMPEVYLKNEVTIDSDYSLYRVNVEKTLNLRNLPQVENSKKLSVLPNGTIIMGKKENEKWSKVVYLNKNTLIEGYSASRFLQLENEKKIENRKQKTEEKTLEKNDKKNNQGEKDDNTKPEIKYTVQNGQVFGIDICEMPEARLEELLTGKVPIQQFIHLKSEEGKERKADLSRFKKRVPDFVYFKLSASRYSGEELRKGSFVPFKRMSEVCERLGVPYGFYYYSTCINEEEAKQEYEWIDEHLQTLEKERYHLLPFVIDVEISDDRYQKKDRQFLNSKKEVTDAKITLANLLEAKTGKVMVYSAVNAFESILDVKQFQDGVKSGDCGIWLVSPSKSMMKHDQIKKLVEDLKPYTISEQIVLDGYYWPPVKTTVMKKVEVKEVVNEKQKKEPKKEIKGAKTEDKKKLKDKEGIKAKDRKTAKDEKKTKDKGNPKQKPTAQKNKENKDNKKENKKIITRIKEIPVTIYKKGKYLIDIDIFDAKMFELCINGDYKKGIVDLTKYKKNTLVKHKKPDELER